MEKRASLFKANSSLLRNKTSNIRAANEIRAKQRRDLFNSTRNISPPPSPKIQSEQKENLQPTVTGTSKLDIEKPLSPKQNKKSARQTAFLMKYMAWKANKIKEEQAKKEQSKKMPFVVPCGSGPANGTRNMKKSFAPRNHTFKPPPNLEDLTIDIVGQNKFRCVSGDQEVVYNIVPTPKKENNTQSKIAEMKLRTLRCINPKPLYLNAISKPEVSKPISASKPVANAAKSLPTTSKCVTQNTANSKVARAPITQSTFKSSQKSNTLQPGSDLLGKPRFKPPPVQISGKPLINNNKHNNIASKFKKPPPSQYLSKNAKKPTTSKTVNSQSGLPPLKRPTFKASKKIGTSISNVFSTVHERMNKKNPADMDGKYLLPNQKTDDIVSETPDPNSLNTVFQFVTSTKRKSSLLKNSKVDATLFAAEGDIMSPIDSSAPTMPNFIRYSIVQTDSETTPKLEEATTKKSSDGVIELDVTPIENTTPPNYMSPYVSVSRGKVSTKVEREKRKSVYMGTDSSVVPEAAAAEHHSMATVTYYKKQLMEEVDRLNEQCRMWEEYKVGNPQLSDIGGTDMIDATIGQTKLLINKKLKQFGGLIDRCEEGLRHKNTANNGGDESFLPILPEDLDGFWSMVGLQIENVDKRFANIERWKSNDWIDPDEAPRQERNVKKIKKSKPATTAKANPALQKMLKAAHAAYLKKKTIGDIDNDVILTPSRRQVVIKDRRSRSAAATIITVNTTKVKRISSEKNQIDLSQTPKLIPHINDFHKSMNLLKSTLLDSKDRKSSVDNNVSSPKPTTSRKSILKAPGSTCSSKNVIFNTLSNFKSDLEQDPEEEQRTYKLRNRRIILRDSAEFEIPK